MILRFLLKEEMFDFSFSRSVSKRSRSRSARSQSSVSRRVWGSGSAACQLSKRLIELTSRRPHGLPICLDHFSMEDEL